MNLTEQRQILEMILRDDSRARSAAMATIVGTQGSTYRRAGARLLIDAEGPISGNLSGGCLEGEIVGEAERVIRDRSPVLLTYDLSADDEAVWGWGLGCNGVMEVFIEPAATWHSAASHLAEALSAGRVVGIATTVTSASSELIGTHLVIRSDGSIAVSSGSTGWDERLQPYALQMLAGRDNAVVSVDDARVFIETLAPPDVLVIFGAGHDAVPVARICSDLGFEIVVVDDREALLDEQRFPEAGGFLDPSRIGDLRKRYPEANLHAVVMTHNYLRDLDHLATLPTLDWTYVGLLGPQRRFDRLVDDLRRREIGVDEKWLSWLHSPAGLDVGAEGPEEIAVAIAAELLAVRSGRGGGFLRERGRPIHES